MSDTDIFNDVSLLFWLCRVYGIYSFRVSKSDTFEKKRLRHKPRHYFISVTFQLMFIGFSVFDVYNYWTEQSNGDLFALAIMIHQFINAMLYTIFVFAARYTINKFNRSGRVFTTLKEV